MAQPLIECVPNFSAGRDPVVVERIAQAIASTPGAKLLAQESDIDHHRAVLTFAGHPDAVLEAAFRAVQIASQTIDLNTHHGVHPRIGAADVVPLVPIQGITLDQCAILAHQLGQRIWTELQIPIYFYEAAALRPERKRLEVVRQGSFETLRQAVFTDPARHPDLGGPALHPTAGATIVGARKYLLAYNINLQTADLAIAKQIARRIRASSGGLPHVKAMGVMLHSRGMAQVSMNLTDFEITPLHTVFAAVQHEASKLGVAIAGSEIIGLMPAAALAQTAAHFLSCENYRDSAILENRLLANLSD